MKQQLFSKEELGSAGAKPWQRVRLNTVGLSGCRADPKSIMGHM